MVVPYGLYGYRKRFFVVTVGELSLCQREQKTRIGKHWVRLYTLAFRKGYAMANGILHIVPVQWHQRKAGTTVRHSY